MSEEGISETNNESPLLPIRAGSTWLVVPALRVVEVVDDIEPVFLPRAPAHVPGLLNLRGTALPLMDIARFLGVPNTAPADSKAFSRVVVTEAAEMTVGLRCTAVQGVIPAYDRPIRPPGQHPGVLGEIALGEVDTPEGIATLIDLGGLLERARVRS